MRRRSLFGYCADFLKLDEYALTDLLNENCEGHFRIRRAERIRSGAESVPGFAWKAIRALWTDPCPEAEKFIVSALAFGFDRLQFTKADMESPERGELMAKVILQLPEGIRVQFDRYAPADEETWGTIGPW